MSTGFYFTCCCGVPFEAWVSAVTGAGVATDQLSIYDLTQQTGEPHCSFDDFSFDDDYNGATLGAIARGDYVYVIQHDSQSTPTELAVSKYHERTGVLQWTQTTSTVVSTANLRGYRVFGVPMSGTWVGGGAVWCCNESELWLVSSKQLFDSAGVTTETASPNTTSDKLAGTSAAWIPQMLSSHDFPRVAGYRIYLENMTNVVYDQTTDQGGGVYRHYYDFDVDETIEYGVGEYDQTTGSMGSVSTEDSYTASRTGVSGYLEDGSATPPATAPSSPSDLDDISSFPSYVLRIPVDTIEQKSFYFSTLGASHYIGVFPFEDLAAATVYERVIIDGTRLYNWTNGSQNAYSVAAVQDERADASYAQALITFRDPSDTLTYMQGLEYDGTSLWKQELDTGGSTLPRVLSVNDTWALVSVDPDGSDTLDYYMWKLDNSEYQLCEDQGGVNTGYDKLTTSVQQLDLVKSVSHPYGPPETYA